MTESEKFIVKTADILEKKLPEGLTLLKDNEHRGMMEVTVIGAPEAKIVLYEREDGVHCFSYISPPHDLPEIIKEELYRVAKKRFPLADIKIPIIELYGTDISEIVDDLFGAFCFYREKVRKCQETELEQKIRELVVKILKI